MRFLQRKYPAKRHEIIQVELDGPAKVKFMTAGEFRKYAGGRTHTYFPGLENGNAVRLTLPFDSIWHAVVEQPKAGAPVKARSMLCAPRPEEPRLQAAMDEKETERELQAVSMGGRSEG
jgi:hypothetical protein